MCNSTLTVIYNPLFLFGKLLQTSLGPLAIFLNVLMIVVLLNAKSIHLHTNLRHLLANVSLCSTIATVYSFVKNLHTFVAMVSGNPCSLFETIRTCKWHDCIFLLSKFPVLFTLTVTGVERWYALRYFQTYASTSNDTRHKVPKIAIVFVWLLSLTFVLFLNQTAPTDDWFMPYCNALFVYDRLYTTVLCVFLLIAELSSLLFFFFLWSRTVSRMSVRVDDASENYQLNDRLARRTTLTVSKFMFASILVHAICWTCILVMAISIINFLNVSLNALIIAEFLFYLPCIVHMVVHPILSIYSCELIRSELAKLFPFLKPYWKRFFGDGDERITDFRTKDEHFGTMTALWERAKGK
uniref:G-protein coupled receptors family 1 profile domain-containing protein n=1 Tax=Romanomermis culicivorax TaxID=13658 RepID=A0A915IJ18_ROMCU